MSPPKPVSPPDPGAATPRRIPALDIARGGALVAMVIYHAGWDIASLGLGAAGLQHNTLWQLFGHAIAACFLTLAGGSLVLAQGRGFDRHAFFRRLALVTAAAALVSGATYVLFPQGFIYFGILHMIALGSVLALPFLRLPVALVLAVAGAVFVLPLLVESEALASLWLVWLGLGSDAPPSHDFVPVFPWFGFILFGVALGRMLPLARLIAPAPARQPARLLQLAGRHTLAVYLLHQPLLYGALWLVAQAATVPVDKEARDFLGSCTRECRTAGGEAKLCTTICLCAVEALKGENLWRDVLANHTGPALESRMGDISRRCAASARSRGTAR
jgi:uncharacterized membrane protein